MLAVVLWLCLGLALPIVMGLYSSEVSTDAVEASHGDEFALSEPVVLSIAPTVRIERGVVAFIDANGQVLPAAVSTRQDGTAQHLSAANAIAPAGAVSQNIRLYNAVISVGPPSSVSKAPASTTSSFPLSPFADALQAGRYEQLSLRNTTLVLNGIFETPETITNVKADVSIRRRGHLGVKGTGLLRGQRVAFEAAINTGGTERRSGEPQRLPLKVSVKGDNIDLAFDGRMQLSADDIELHGQGEMSMASVRGMARWFGAYWPAGPALRDLSIRGQMVLARQLLAFENAVARIDGNEATGVLGLHLRQPRPMLTGTLAFKSLDTRPYLSSTPSDASRPLSWASLASGVLTVPLSMHLDADLRISTDRLQVGPLEMGRAAATIALKDGKLLADIAELRFNGAEGGGQVTADFTGFVPKVTVRGKLEQVDLGLLTGAVSSAGQFLQGKAGIVCDVAGSGNTFHEVLAGLTGKLSVRGQSPGRMALDLRSLAGASREREIIGWGGAARGATGYENLDLRLVLRDGTILAEMAEVRTSEAVWTAVGVVNLISDRLDLRLSQGTFGAGGQVAAATQPMIEVHGPLREPRVRAATSP